MTERKKCRTIERLDKLVVVSRLSSVEEISTKKMKKYFFPNNQSYKKCFYDIVCDFLWYFLRKSTLLGNLGSFHTYIQQNQQALKAFNEALKIYAKYPELDNSLKELAEIYETQDKFSESLLYY